MKCADSWNERWWQLKSWKYGKLLLIWQDTAEDAGLWQLYLPGYGPQKPPTEKILQLPAHSHELQQTVLLTHDLLDRDIAPETPPPGEHICCGWNRFSPFETKVLDHLIQIPVGKAMSYGALAEWSGYPRAARAVGRLMAKNPFPLFYPCHRVIRADGQLGNFGGGTPMKHRLLEDEGIIFQHQETISPQSLFNPQLNLFLP